MASRHSRSSTPPDAVPSRYRNIRYKSDLYVQDVPTESYTRDAADFKVVNDEHEAIVIDNGTTLPLFTTISHSDGCYRNIPSPRRIRFPYKALHQRAQSGRQVHVTEIRKDGALWTGL